ncbi:MAG TPA: ATP-binding cassette domain-containing protein, partial [Acidimicrobiia bacterium]|nr:ATP-binding cassette domain-containing protein [Acidimicrobiia bacterium]
MTTVEAPPITDGLRLEGITVRFGGHVAVDGLSLSAPVGRITGLIGPNGAGKTTTFNACSGLQSVASGRVYLDGEDVTGLGPAPRARRGLGRTFQRMELFDTMTVRENVEIGREALLAGKRRWTGRLFSTPAEAGLCGQEAEEAMAHCGISHLAARTVGDLSTGQRRLVELARALAGDYRFLLLDEPSSGLDVGETEQFAAILSGVVEREGIGI